MTNKQRYQRTFSALHASEDKLWEVKAMKHTRRLYMPRLAAACAAAVLTMGLASAAYAADVGGIQRSIQIWVNGDQTDAVLDVRDSSYTVTYQDQDGVSHEFGGGGVAFNSDGSERPLTEEEIMDHLDSPDVQYRDDGSVWVCYRGGETEITGQFDEDGVCYVQLRTGGGSLYLTVKYQGGFASSPHSYVSPRSFNTGTDE